MNSEGAEGGATWESKGFDRPGTVTGVGPAEPERA
jgi:hypothetical protein